MSKKMILLHTHLTKQLVMIKMDDARAIAKEWKKRKEKNPSLQCDHHELEKEYFNGTATGDRVCINCGETFYEGKIPDNKQ